MARTYKRDSRGRFASTGSARSGPKSRMATRGTNRITRDNAGRITSVGGQGATARGGRLRTAAGNRRGAVVARMSLQRSGTIGKPKGLKPGALNRVNLQAKRIARAKDIIEKNADRRTERFANRRPSKKQIRSVRRAEKALEFYTDPLKAMRENNKLRAGFRMPRDLRGKLIYQRGEGYVALPKVVAPGSRRKVRGPKMTGTIAKPHRRRR